MPAEDRVSGHGAGESAGLYVHLPYCVRRCGYCTFVLTTDFSTRDRYLEALAAEAALAAAEAALAAAEAPVARFDTLYLGGGTPSAVPAPQLASMIGDLRRTFVFDALPEVTLEANPDDVSPAAIDAWRSAGITRVSLGIQSFRDTELVAVDRIHSAREAEDALLRLLESGLDVSCDLMIGIPGQEREGFLADVGRLAGSAVGHVSVYILELDRAKTMAEDRERRPERYLSDDAQADAYLEGGRRLADAGFRHDEVSNWSRPGKEGRHNSKYWRRVPTLGLGVGAHEFWNGRRRANTASLGAYLDSVEHGKRPISEDRPIDAVEREREEIILGARTRAGVAADRIESWLRERGDAALRDDWKAWQDDGLIEGRDGRYVLTERGFLLSSEILCRFV
jgi:oxygen-independent coproporphyrinogen-3 oxidase